MSTLLSNLVDIITEWVHKIKRKDCDYCFEYENIKNNSIKSQQRLFKLTWWRIKKWI